MTMPALKTLICRGDYINGQFILPETIDGEIKDISPSDLTDTIMKVPFSHDRIDQACHAAKAAYKNWSHLTMDERKSYLLRLKEVFQSRMSEITEVMSRDTGKPLWEAKTEIQAVISKIDITLNESIKLVQTERIPNALPSVDGVIRFKSRGVMAVIGPFNFPIHLPNGHIIPSLLMGNTIVFKPSEQTPAVCQFYAEAFEKAEFPAGVFNMVHGDGESGRKLVAHDQVDGILFTGSYEVGLRIKQETITHYWKILALEMGGKNATVIWEDADMEK
ncbi:MAG: aldehyde dehydrogenase family protein, partial [Pseudobdellovibrionaceae bacterium]